MKVTIENVDMSENGLVELSVPAMLSIVITAKRARQLVGIYMGEHVGLALHGDTPDELIVRNQRAFWRVPVILSQGLQGRLGTVGSVDVDAQSGELILDDSLIQEIKENARNLAASSTPHPVG